MAAVPYEGPLLTDDVTQEDRFPYFLWNRFMTIREFRREIAEPTDPVMLNCMVGQMLRVAEYDVVWQFVTPQWVWDRWEEIERHLGDLWPAREYWTYLFGVWKRHGLVT